LSQKRNIPPIHNKEGAMTASTEKTNHNLSRIDGTIKPVPRKYDRLKNIVTAIALVAFNCFVFYNGGPFFWTVSFFVGVFVYDHVKRRITDVFNQMSWMWIIPTTGILYGLSWPATITMQAILSGLDMGSRWSYAARGLLEENGGKIFLCFRV
jgi:hypothetical protein